MLNPSIDDLLEVIDDRYSLVIAASKRARQIIESEVYESMETSSKPVSIAAKEIIEGRVKCFEME